MSQHGVNDLLKEELTLDTLKLSKAQKHALYTLIASVRPEMRRRHVTEPSHRSSHDDGYDQGVKDYDNAIKEILGE